MHADCSLQLKSARSAADVANSTAAATKLALDQAQSTLVSTLSAPLTVHRLTTHAKTSGGETPLGDRLV